MTTIKRDDHKNNDFSDDELNINEILTTIIAEKKILLSSVIVFLITALLYIFIKPTYIRSTAYLEVPDEKEVAKVNNRNVVLLNDMRGTKIPAQFSVITAPELFTSFIQNLKSREVSRAVFIKYQLNNIYYPKQTIAELIKNDSLLERAVLEFENNFSSKSSDKSTTGAIAELTMKDSSGVGTNVLSEMIELANKKTLIQYQDRFGEEREALKKRIAFSITNLRADAREKRLTQIIKLNDAIAIARKLNIQSPHELLAKLSFQDPSRDFPLYYLGVRFLDEEKRALEGRKNDDPYIEDLEIWKSWQEAVEKDSGKVSFTPSRVLYKFDSRVEFNRVILLVGAIFLGIGVGFFIIYCRYILNLGDKKKLLG